MNLQQKKETIPIYTYGHPYIINNTFLWEFVRFIILNYYMVESVLASSFYSVFIFTQTTLLPMNIIFLLFLAVDFAYKICLAPYPEFIRSYERIKIRKLLRYYLITHYLLFDLTILVIFAISYAVPFDAARYIRLIISLRIVEIVNFNNRIDKKLHTYGPARKIYTIFKICYVMFLFSHYFGCWFYLMDQLLINNQTYGPVNTANQLYYQMNMQCLTPIEALDDAGRYLYGLYFMVSLITTIAFGDIVGKNPVQQVYVTILMILSTISIALILQQFMMVVRDESLGFYEFIKNYNCLKTRMDDSAITRQLQNKVRSYLVYIEYQRKFHAHEPIVDKLPEKLRNDLAQEGYSHYLAPVFEGIDMDQIYSLCKICDQCTFQAQTEIFSVMISITQPQETKTFSFLYMRSGIVEEYLNLTTKKKFLPTHRKFFNLAKLILNCRIDVEAEPCPFLDFNERKLRCIKLSQFIEIKNQNFENYVNENFELLKNIRAIRQRIVVRENILQKIGEECSLCPYPNNFDHTCENCPFSHLVFSENIKEAEKIYFSFYRMSQERKHSFERKKVNSTKIKNKVHTSVIWRKFQQKENEGGIKVISLIKKIVNKLSDEIQEHKHEVDSTYDPNGSSEYCVDYQSKQTLKKNLFV